MTRLPGLPFTVLRFPVLCYTDIIAVLWPSDLLLIPSPGPRQFFLSFSPRDESSAVPRRGHGQGLESSARATAVGSARNRVEAVPTGSSGTAEHHATPSLAGQGEGKAG